MNNAAERCKTRMRTKHTEKFKKGLKDKYLPPHTFFATGFNVGFEEGYKRAEKQRDQSLTRAEKDAKRVSDRCKQSEAIPK